MYPNICHMYDIEDNVGLPYLWDPKRGHLGKICGVERGHWGHLL